MWSRSRWALVGCAVAAGLLAGNSLGAFALAEYSSTTTVGGVPITEVLPGRGVTGAPGVVVAHGFAGSARLMRGFADTLSRRGYVVVLLDFAGHGASTRRLPTVDGEREAALQRDLNVAVRHLRSSPAVDPGRIGLVGHSMGAAAVTRYAATHPDIDATVAISLGSASAAAMPGNLLAIVGGAEFPAFREAALTAAGPTFGVTRGDPASRTARRAVSVPAVEHISVLFATITHEETSAWLDAVLGQRVPAGTGTAPRSRLVPAGFLLLAFILGFVPLAYALLGRRERGAEPGREREPEPEGAPGPEDKPPPTDKPPPK